MTMKRTMMMSMIIIIIINIIIITIIIAALHCIAITADSVRACVNPCAMVFMDTAALGRLSPSRILGRKLQSESPLALTQDPHRLQRRQTSGRPSKKEETSDKDKTDLQGIMGAMARLVLMHEDALSAQALEQEYTIFMGSG